MVNELEFFNQATLRICSNLDIGEVAQSCLEYRENYLPLDGVMMNYFDEKNKSIVVLAVASKIPQGIPRAPIPASEEIHQLLKTGQYKFLIFNETENDPVVYTVWKPLGLMEKSSIVLFVYLKGQRFDQIDFFVDRHGQ